MAKHGERGRERCLARRKLVPWCFFEAMIFFLHSRLSSWSGGERSSCKAFRIAAGMTDAVSSFCKICKASKIAFISSCCDAHLVSLSWLDLDCCWWSTNLVGEQMCVCACKPLTFARLRIKIMNLSQQGGWLFMQVPAQRRGLHVTLISLETSSEVPASNIFERVSNCWPLCDFRLLQVEVDACFHRIFRSDCHTRTTT